MGVGVHGECKRRVSEHLHHDQGGIPLGKEEACRGVTAVVQPVVGNAEAGATRTLRCRQLVRYCFSSMAVTRMAPRQCL